MATVRAGLRREDVGGTPEGLAGGWAQGEQQRTAAAEGLARPMLEYAKLVPEPMVGQLRFGDFPYQLEWYSDEVADAEEVVWIKATQVGMCLAPETRVLTADLRWVPIESLRPGVELVGVDEDPPQAVARSRKLRRATVTAIWRTERPARRLTMTDGRVVVASPEHRWLVSRGSAGRKNEWRPTGRLRVGQLVRSVVTPWGEPDFEDGWFAGMLDGEGHFRQSGLGGKVTIVQCVGPVHDRIERYIAARGIAASYGVKRREQAHWTPCGCWQISRGADVMRLIGQLRPSSFMGGVGFWEGMCPPGSGGSGYATIAEIEELPQTELVDLETTTGTFVAEGLVSHNSAYAWRWAVRRTDQYGETCVYVFPTDKHVTEFGDERIEPAIEESQYLRSRIGSRFVRNKHLKRIGRGFLHLRGSNSKAGAQSVAAQCLVFDEYDFLDPTNLPQIERRITGARQLGLRPRIRRLGTPTIDGYGIALAWESSDRRVWMVPCPECGLEQEVTWEENVRWRNEPDGEVMRAGHDEFGDPNHVEEAWRACSGCEARLDVREGRWEATNPGAKVIGFHATRLIVPLTDLHQIIVASRKTKPGEVETFENNDLGRPYSASEAQLSAAEILTACQMGGGKVGGYVGPGAVTMGVDVAGERNLTVRISEQLPAEAEGIPNPRRALWIGECKSFREVQGLIEAFRCQVVVIDGNPERRMARAMQATYPGRVVIAEYDYRDDSDSMKITEQGEAGTVLEGVPLKVRVNRTEALDAMMDSIRQTRNRPLSDPPAKYVDQLRAPKRRTVLDAKGRPHREYVSTGNAGDDYAHAEVYDLIATEIWRVRQGVQQAAQRSEHVPDEEIGFRRVRLDRDHGGYTRGFE